MPGIAEPNPTSNSDSSRATAIVLQRPLHSKSMISHRLPQILPHLRNTIARRAFATGSQRSLRLPRLSIFEALDSHPKSKVAIVHSESGKSFTYGDLLADTARYRSRLMMLHKPEFRMDLGERRIAFLVENGYHYVGMHLLDGFE